MQLDERSLSPRNEDHIRRYGANFSYSKRKNYLLYVPILLLSLLYTTILSAQVPPSISKFHHLTTETGLSDVYNAFVSRDSFGFTWFSSTDGLNRFDGRSIKVYGRDQLGHSDVTSYCFQDSTGNLWFTSYNSINHYLRAEDRFEQIYLSREGKIAKQDYYAFHLSSSGDLWIRLGAGEQGLIYTYNIYTGEQQMQPNLQSGGIRIKASDDGDGRLGLAISTYLPGKTGVDLVVSHADLEYELIHTAPINADGKKIRTYNAWIENEFSIWVATGEGVAQLTYRNGEAIWLERFDVINGQQLGLVRDVVGFGDNLLLLATKDHGLVFLDKTTGEAVGQYLADSTDTNSLQHDQLRELMLDHEANLWISAYGYGVDYCNLKKVKFSGRPGESVNSILPVGDHIYISAGKGKIQRLNKQLQPLAMLPFPYPTTKPNARPVILYPHIPGKFWAASGRYLALFNETTSTWEQSLTLDAGIKSLLRLENGRCLVSTENSYFEINSLAQSFEILPAKDLEEFAGNPSTFMFEGQDGRVYLAKNASSLLVFENRNERLVLRQEIEDVGYIFGAATIPDEAGIWMTGSFGLAHLIGDSLHIEGGTDPSYRLQSFYGILPYEDKLWLSGNVGLYNYDIKTKKFRAYQETDGMIGWRFSQTAYVKDGDGTFYFGGENGLNYFDPSTITDITIAPKIQLLEFRAQEKPYYKADSLEIFAGNLIVLEPSDNTFSISFVGMEYSDPSFITYRVKLEGVDPDWVSMGSLNQIRYPSVAPGTYNFQIIAQNPDGVESKPYQLTIRVRPFFYQTNWFKAMLGLLALTIAWLVYQDQLSRRLRKEKVKNLEALNAFKSRFFTNITHEFRSPLNIILSYLDTALQRNKSLKKGNLEIMQRSGKQLLYLVNQILDLRRLEVAKIEVQYEEMDGAKLAKAVVEDFQKLAYGKGIKLEYGSEPTEVMISSDREKLRKILSNLVSNAIKFTSRGGVVKMHVYEKNEDISFIVTDTGIGIAKDKLPHIFEQFYQAHDENTNKFGSGVGLALSRELAQAMGGKFTVKSKVGEGSTFTLTLPKVEMGQEGPDGLYADANEPKVATVDVRLDPIDPDQDTEELAEQLFLEAVEEREEKPLVLIVEDNANFRQYIQEILLPHYRTVVRNNGEDGLKAAMKLVPDLVVTDVKMPIMDGYELTTALKSTAATCHIPVVLLTGLDDIDARVKGIEAGADMYLNKPFHKQELLSWMDNLLKLREKLQGFYRGIGVSTSDVSHDPHEPNDPDREFIRRVKAAIEENFHRDSFSVKELSEMMKMEYVTFYRKFKAIMNENAKKTIQDRRLSKARELLISEPSKRIREIAFEVGFNDPGHFSKTFKEVVRMTPKEFREQSP